MLSAYRSRSPFLLTGTDDVASVVFFGSIYAPSPHIGLVFAVWGEGYSQPVLSPVASPYAERSVLAMDSVDRPYVVFLQDYDSPPSVARFDIPSGSWVTELLPGPSVADGDGLSLTVGVDNIDRPVVAYVGGYADPHEEVTLAIRGDSGWIIRTEYLGDRGGIGSSSGLALAFDSANAPHIAYTNSSGDLAILRFNILNATQQIVPMENAIKLGPRAMHIDAAYRIRIAGLIPNLGQMVLADNQYGWNTQEFGLVNGHETSPPSLAIDSQGRWAVAYGDPGGSGEIVVEGTAIANELPGDCNCDGIVNIDDFEIFAPCLGCFRQ